MTELTMLALDAIAGCCDSLEKLHVHKKYRFIVMGVAKKYLAISTNRFEPDDALQIVVVESLSKLNKFCAEKGSFETWLTWIAIRALSRAVCDCQTKFIAIPQTMLLRIQQVIKIGDRLLEEGVGYNDLDVAIANEMNISPKLVTKARRYSDLVLLHSFDFLVSDGEEDAKTEMGELTSSENISWSASGLDAIPKPPEQSYIESESIQELSEIMEQLLTYEQQQLVQARYMVDGNRRNKAYLNKVTQIFQCTPSKASAVEKSETKKIRNAMKKYGRS
jgi:RNA polymerase sigma factor (sigma-70 family)